MDDARKLRRSLERVGAALRAVPVDVGAGERALGEANETLETLLEEWTVPYAQPAEDWCRALREQAAEDLTAASLVAEEGGPASVLAMLLQMTFEKIAKAVFARADLTAFAAYRRSHMAASLMVKMIRNHGGYTALRHAWKTVLPLVEGLERAHPALAPRGPHLEYPWEATESLHVPRELPIVAELGDPKRPRAPELLRLARELLTRFDEIFPG